MRKLTAIVVIALLAATAAYAQRHVVEQGRIRSVSAERDTYRVYLDHGDYSFRVPFSLLGRRDLRPGMFVRFEGVYRGGHVWVEEISWPNERRDEFLSGRVERVNRSELRLWVRDERGRLVEIDGRGIESRRRLDFGDIRRGDRVTLRGRWERSTFYANRVENISSR